MRTIKVTIETGYVGCDHVSVFEVADDASDADIDEMVADVVGNYISTSWEEVADE